MARLKADWAKIDTVTVARGGVWLPLLDSVLFPHA